MTLHERVHKCACVRRASVFPYKCGRLRSKEDTADENKWGEGADRGGLGWIGADFGVDFGSD